MKRTGIYVALVLTLLFCIPSPGSTYAQCTVCRATVENSEGEKGELKKGVNSGILYLMGIPYIILVGTVILAVRYRRAKKAEEEQLRNNAQNHTQI